MSTGNLVMALPDHPALRADVLALLRRRPGITVGDVQGRLVPLAFETVYRQQDVDLLQWLEEVPGVEWMELEPDDVDPARTFVN